MPPCLSLPQISCFCFPLFLPSLSHPSCLLLPLFVLCVSSHTSLDSVYKNNNNNTFDSGRHWAHQSLPRSLLTYSCLSVRCSFKMLSVKQGISMYHFLSLCMTWSGFEPPTSQTQRGCCNHYTTEAGTVPIKRMYQQNAQVRKRVCFLHHKKYKTNPQHNAGVGKNNHLIQ